VIEVAERRHDVGVEVPGAALPQHRGQHLRARRVVVDDEKAVVPAKATQH
jgi:hypothetical protein